MSTAYCMTCHKKMPVTNVQAVRYPNGRTAERGACACGTKTHQFTKAGK